MFFCGVWPPFCEAEVGTPVLSNASPLLTAPHLVFTDRGGTDGKAASSIVFAPARAVAVARLAGHARRFQTRSRFAWRTMENFFKRKDPPNGASGISASANKSAKTSSPAGKSGASPKWIAMHGSLSAPQPRQVSGITCGFAGLSSEPVTRSYSLLD